MWSRRESVSGQKARKAEYDGVCLLIPTSGGRGRRIVSLWWVFDQLGLHNATLSQNTKCVWGDGEQGGIKSRFICLLFYPNSYLIGTVGAV